MVRRDTAEPDAPGPADTMPSGFKMLNSGGTGVMLDLEDSMANFGQLGLGSPNLLSALNRRLSLLRRQKKWTVGLPEADCGFHQPAGHC